MAMNHRLMRPKASGTLWTPTQLGSSVALWLDPSDATSITLNGSSVSQWNDISGNGRHFSIAVAAEQPTYTAAGINNLGCVSFDGVNDRIFRNADAWTYNYPVNAFIVFNATAFTTSYNGLFGFYSANDASAAGYGIFVKSAGKSAVYATDTLSGQDNYDGTGAITYATATTNIMAATLQNGSIQTWANGATDGTATGSWTLRTNVGATPFVAVGVDYRFSRFTQWKIGEALLVTGSAMSSADRQKMEGYLAWKWGATDQLASTHPYKNTRPLK